MRRTLAIVAGVVLAASLTAMAVGVVGAHAGVQQDGAQNETNESAANESIEPGEHLNGVIGVQEAEIDGEMAQRTYGVKLANATTNESKAEVVGEQLEDAEARLDELETRIEELEAMREAGEISEGQYRSEVAKAEAEKATIERLAEGAAVTAAELPDDVLAENGVNVTAIEELRNRTDELGGPETAEIAKSIGGDDVGQSFAGGHEPGAPIETPGSGEPGNGTDDAGPPEEQNGTDGGPGDVDTGEPDDIDTGEPDDVDTGGPDDVDTGEPDDVGGPDNVTEDTEPPGDGDEGNGTDAGPGDVDPGEPDDGTETDGDGSPTDQDESDADSDAPDEGDGTDDADTSGPDGVEGGPDDAEEESDDEEDVVRDGGPNQDDDVGDEATVDSTDDPSVR